MKIRVLGSAAGGGFPQWNCNCYNCNGVRNGGINAHARTQSSIAVSMDDEHWVLFNTSPDIRAQLESFPEMHPQGGMRGTGISAIILADSQIDHTTGMLMLREGCPLPVYVTDMVQEDLTTGFPIFSILKSWNGGLDIHRLATDEKPFTIPGIDGIEFTAVPIDGKAPPYSPHRHDPHIGDNLGFYIRDIATDQSVFYSPGLAAVTDHVRGYMEKSTCVMVDGTFWCEDEMSLSGVGTKKASDMGHLPQSGEDGMLKQLEGLPEETRKVLIHINNTNPILIEDSPERKILDDLNVEVAYDGMRLIFE
jgi:pyrroloquinoline quinone biosynthesis protein B